LKKEREILEDGSLLICRCEEITKQEVVDAINEGYRTVNDIRKRTRAGMGFCQGKTCGKLIQKLIYEYGEEDYAKIQPARTRPPVRPIASDIFSKGADEI